MNSGRVSLTPPSHEMLRAMLVLQDSMNRKINESWLSAGYPFLRAIVVEAVEALEHYGWKWWKSQQPDVMQLRIELVDIWHFLMSHYLVQFGGDITMAANQLAADWTTGDTIEFDGRSYDLNTLDTRHKLELLTALAAVRRNVTRVVVHLFGDCGMTSSGLFTEYVSKNVLNHFRQDHGYKTGEYRKIWDGREDNSHLSELLNSLDTSSDSLAQKLYAALKARYESLSAAGRTS